MRTLGRLRVPNHADVTEVGLASWRNPGNGFYVLAVHYTADPTKRQYGWKQDASKGYTQRSWNQEYEIDFESWAGLPVYLSFEPSVHVAAEPLQWRSNRWMYRGWDIGIHACVWAQVLDGQLRVFRAKQIAGAFTSDNGKYAEDELTISGLGSFIQECKDLSAEWFPNARWQDIGDPSIFNNTVMRERKPSQVFLDHGISLQMGETQDISLRINYVESWLDAMHKGVPCFQVDPRARLLIDGMAGGYCREKEGAGAKPEKNAFSHCLVGETLVATPAGNVPLQRIRVGDRVTTPYGAFPVTAVMRHVTESLLEVVFDDEILYCTPNHPFFLASGQTLRADELRGGNTVWADPRPRRFRSSTDESIIKQPDGPITAAIPTRTEGGGTCIEMSGSSFMALFRQGFMSTIRTKMGDIMTLPTWSYCPNGLMPNTILLSGIGRTQSSPLQYGRWPWTQQSHGTGRQKDSRGILATRGPRGSSERHSHTPARIVESGMTPSFDEGSRAIALPPAKAWHEKHLALTMPHASVPSAKNPSCVIGTPSENSVRTVVTVNRVGGHQRVYDLTVDTAHCFYANGVLVGNCQDALQYLCSKLPTKPFTPYSRPEEELQPQSAATSVHSAMFPSARPKPERWDQW